VENNPSDMELKYSTEGDGVDPVKLGMELMILIAMELNSEKTVRILEKNGVKVGYHL
jgi:hypothetical protein